GALMGASGMAIPASDLETVAVVRPPDGRRLLYFLNSSGQWVAPAGESAVLSVSGSTAAPSGFVWSADDRLVYSYDGAGRLVSVTDRNGSALLLEYSSGLLSAVRDPDGRVLYSFSRDGAGRVSSVTDIGGRAHYFGYTGSGLLERLEGPEGVSTFGYQGYSVSGLEGFAGGYFAPGGWGNAELLSRVTPPGGQVTSYAYSAPAYRVDHSRDCKSVPAFNYAGAERCALLAGAAAPADKVYLAPLAPAASGYYFVDRAAFSAWYFPQRYYLSSKTGPSGTYTYEYIVDDQTGEGETRITPPLGGKEVVRWNKSNGHFRRAYTVDGAGGKTLFAYDSANNPVQVTDPAGNIRGYAWDAKNRLTAATDPLNNRINIGYDPSSGNISYYADAKGNTAHFSYDANGNLSRITDAAGQSTDITNNARGLPLTITDPLGHSVTIGRDGYGNATSVTDALNRNSAFAYDVIGRVTRMTDPAGKAVAFAYNPDNTPGTVTDAIGGVTRYGYEPGGFETGAKRLVSLTDAANHGTAFAYDAQGRLASVTDPLNHAAAYGYDAAGRISAAADANGSSFAFGYDILGRLTSATAPDGQTVYSYDLANNLTSIEDPRTKLQFGYDAAGRVTATSAQDKIANLGGAFTYTYDAAGNRLAMTASGYTWSYSYDALNRPVTITAPGGTQFQFTYDAAGRRTRMDMGTAVAAEYVYDAANQLTGITYRRKTDNAVIASVGYTYDTAGNRAAMTDDFGAHTFGYDDLHRLTSAVHPSSGALSVQSETFAYDAVGNRQSDAVRAGYAYDAANRLNSDSQYTYAYDNNGNLTTKTRASDNAQTAYIYDAQNRLTQVNLPSGYSETLRYDATGRRIAKTITHNGETIREQHYIYDGEDIAFVTGADGALKATYTHGPGTDEPLMLRKGASDYYLLADGLGSIIAIADQTGTVVERAQYQAYGKPVFRNEITASTSSWSQTGSLYSYTAREWDAETGLFYYRARYYAPDTGRFIQKDPIGFNGGDTNLYAYVYNNPGLYRDASGTTTNSKDDNTVAIGVRWARGVRLPHSYIKAGKDTYSFVPSVQYPFGGIGEILHNEPIDQDAWFYIPTGIENDDPVVKEVLEHIPPRSWLGVYNCHTWAFEMVSRMWYLRLMNPLNKKVNRQGD
ncbi:MAG: RHS repeat-associated core domain-containing protein, partial [Elusimicrobiales bacterium]